MKRPIACLTGASGGLGQNLLPRLKERYTVRALFRKSSSLSQNWAGEGCEVVPGDLNDPDALRALTRGAEVVIHCAARILGMSRKEFEATNVTGTRNLVEHAVREGCRRFVHLSSIAVYSAATPAGDYAEDVALTPSGMMDPYGLSKLRSEEVVKALTRSTGTEAVILRPTCIYGPHMDSWTRIPLTSIARGRALMLGLDEGSGLLDAVHVEDVVQAVLAAAETTGINGETFNIGHETVKYADFYAYLGDMVGKKPRLGASRQLHQWRRAADAGARWTQKLFPAVRDGIDQLLRMAANTRSYPSTRARQRLGYAPRVSLPVGMLRTELWLREQGRMPRVDRRLPNTDRHYEVRPAALMRPRSPEDIARALRATSGIPVKAIGALHSFAPIPDTKGLCLAMDRYGEPVAMEGNLVTVQAGMTISRLNAYLARQGLALPAHGSHAAQTVGGAISTATHGGSLHRGVLSDFVEAVQIIRPSGDSVTVRRGDACFEGVVVSLGLLGVLSTVTLRCEPRFWLDARAVVKPVDGVLESFDLIHRENEFVDLHYYPRIGQVEMMLANRIPAEVEVEAPIRTVTATHPGALKRRLASLSFRTILKGLAVARFESLHRAVSTRRVGTAHKPCRGSSESVLVFTDLEAAEPFPIDDLEFAISYESTVEALRNLAIHFRKSDNWPRFFPIHIRTSKGGGHWLAPNYRRDTCWLEFWNYPPDIPFYRELHSVLAPFGYRSHWGKISVAERDYLSAQYPRWSDFERLRAEWDPEGRFLNDWARRLFL